MAKQDNYIKTALRLPRSLHAEIIAAAEKSERTMNAEIVARLDASFKPERLKDTVSAELADEFFKVLVQQALEDKNEDSPVNKFFKKIDKLGIKR